MTEKERLIERIIYLRDQIEHLYFHYDNGIKFDNKKAYKIDTWFENVIQKMTLLLEEIEDEE